MPLKTGFTAAAVAIFATAAAAQRTIHKPGDPGVQRPAAVKEFTPFYTTAAMHNGIEGTVLLTTVIDTKGRPRQIKVMKSLDSGLDENAVKALEKWRFTPATKDGRPVDFELLVSMTFDRRGGRRDPVYVLPDPEIVNPAVVKDVKPNIVLREGMIKLEGIVETDGSVSSVRVLQTSHAELNDIAMRAFLATRFKPAMRANAPVACRVEMEYTFFVR